MDADFKFDLTRSGWAVIEGSVLDAKVSDIILDSPARRGPGGGPFRRALVHDQSDGLTVNFNGETLYLNLHKCDLHIVQW